VQSACDELIDKRAINTGASWAVLSRDDTGSTTARSVDEVALIRDTISQLCACVYRTFVQSKAGELISPAVAPLILAIDGNLNLRSCVQCRKWFTLEAGKGRSDKEYCTNACRMRAYRKRKGTR
jgi:hypothetical protein